MISGLQANEEFAKEVAKITQDEGFDSALKKCDGAVEHVANLCYNALENADGEVINRKGSRSNCRN